MKPYSTWKYIVLLVVTLVGVLYALPNLYGEDPAVQVTRPAGDPLPADFGATVFDSSRSRLKANYKPP